LFQHGTKLLFEVAFTIESAENNRNEGILIHDFHSSTNDTR
jgi:hypothetical protein